MSAFKTQLVATIKDRCKTCYTCVRNCPAKAIRINAGQAEVIAERCIGCGNCVRVCTQKAKMVADSTWHVERLLSRKVPLVAMVAPSFPAEFDDMSAPELCGYLRAMGFTKVVEVAFGADIVARRYNKLYHDNEGGRYIETSCPAVVAYIQKYHPGLIEHLAPLVSPMVAAAKALDALSETPMKKVFIGPCVAKKEEAAQFSEEAGIEAALTFRELREMMGRWGGDRNEIRLEGFDEPRGGLGRVYPLSHGFFQAAGITENLLESEAISADGQHKFVEAIKEFESGQLDVRLLEMLCCQGCIMGAGINRDLPLYQRHARVSAYAKGEKATFDPRAWNERMEALEDLDLSRHFVRQDIRMAAPNREQLADILAQMGKTSPEDELNCGACGYESCVEHAVAIHKGLAEVTMCLPHTIERLRVTIGELEESNETLATTREALMHSERLASMGQLAAGIAHEVNNPLGVILLYSHLLLERCEPEDATFQELQMIVEQTDRCKRIVSGLLNFARQNKVARQPVDMRLLLGRLADAFRPHGETVLERDFPDTDLIAEVDADQIAQVVTNLLANAADATAGQGTITLGLVPGTTSVEIFVRDTGCGIPEENIKKVFTPFFTTKRIGKGTGLGLAVSYGIVKMHSGNIRVESQADAGKGPTGTTFTVTLPRLEEPLTVGSEPFPAHEGSVQ